MRASTPLLNEYLADDAATAYLGQRLAPHLNCGDTVLLKGDLGAGKSALARAIIRARTTETTEVPSPTFTLVQSYEAGDVELWHCDLYRLGDPEEIVELGLLDAFDTAICLIEWPERLAHLQPARHLAIALSDEDSGRRVEIHGMGDRWEHLGHALQSLGRERATP